MKYNNRDYDIITFKQLPIKNIQKSNTERNIFGANKFKGNQKNVCSNKVTNYPEIFKPNNLNKGNKIIVESKNNNCNGVKKVSLINQPSTTYDFIFNTKNNRTPLKDIIYNCNNTNYIIKTVSKFTDRNRLYAPNPSKLHKEAYSSQYGFHRIKGLCSNEINNNSFRNKPKFTTIKKFFIN